MWWRGTRTRGGFAPLTTDVGMKTNDIEGNGKTHGGH